MSAGKLSKSQVFIALFLFISFSLLVACQSSEAEQAGPEKLQTQLLVRAPEAPLPVNQPLTVRSHTQDPHAVSHIELYAVELPSGETEVLLRADKAPFAQTSFTASQTFTPIQPGHYVIKVVGYNLRGEKAESNFISFDIQ